MKLVLVLMRLRSYLSKMFFFFRTKSINCDYFLAIRCLINYTFMFILFFFFFLFFFFRFIVHLEVDL